MEPTDNEVITAKFADLLFELHTRKPGDRSEMDRRWAVTKTLAEQAFGYFNTYVLTKPEPNDDPVP